jgi:asparagine synthetase B (glutamine-hydrolysing)
MESDIKSFLLLGYFLDFKESNVQFDFSGIDPGRYLDRSEDELIDIGIEKLKSSVKKLMDDGRENIVPLSGGLDSRAILACLNELTGGNDIICYTYGIPGSFDYKIARDLSKRLEIKHLCYPLNGYKFSLDEEMEVARRFRYQTVLFFHPPMPQIEEIAGGRIIWSGFIGGEIAGSHVLSHPSTDPVSAKNNFLKKNTFCRSGKYFDYQRADFYKTFDLKWEHNEIVHMDDQLDFLNRQKKYIGPHVLMDGYDYRTPFYNSDFQNFMLSLPLKYRYRKNIYKKILMKAYPDLFSYGVKENIGLRTDAPWISVLGMEIKEKILKKVQGESRWDKRVNYFDMNSEIRGNSSLRKIMKETISKLDSRELGFKTDPQKILKDHLSRKIDAGDILLTMSSLQIIMENRGNK